MYRSLSRTAHGTNVVRGKLSSGKGGEMEIQQLRFPEGVRATTMLAGTFGVHCIRVFVDAVVPDRRSEVVEWYGRIRERHLNLPDIVREA
jgi:hypothetical protein